mmetsp:Transcript_17991/g.26380  ORF Transcript_17991/g.26380 Transcript_17991/m.26380 type:complete len:1495 (-) Transcript_17991:800-5284(-)
MSLEESDKNEIISIDDDDDDDVNLQQAIRTSLEDCSSSSSVRKANRKIKARKLSESSFAPKKNDNFISLLSDDEDEDEGNKKKRSRIEVGGADINGSDDVIVLEAPTEPVIELFGNRNTSGDGLRQNGNERLQSKESADDDEVEEIGRSNVQRLPHMRQHCLDYCFTQDVLFKRKSEKSNFRDEEAKNAKYCDLCYCFVCDLKASECKTWTSSSSHSYQENHCLACDQGRDAFEWRNLREKKKRMAKNNNDSSSSSSSITSIRDGRQALSFLHSFLHDEINENDIARLRIGGMVARVSADKFGIGKGPFPPSDTEASTCEVLTKCRKCLWYSRFEHSNYRRKKTKSTRRPNGSYHMTRVPDLHHVGELDWCHNCGRVANERDFFKEQSISYKPDDSDVFLGTKTLPFRIKSHDPRTMAPFQSYWSEEGQTYDQSEMDEDMFKHRIGEYPLLKMLLSSIPIVAEGDIPKTGTVRNPVTTQISGSWRWTSEPPAAAHETEAILLESLNHRVLLEELYHFHDIAEQKNEDVLIRMRDGDDTIGGDIRATWDKAGRKGELTIRLYLRKNSFIENSKNWATKRFKREARLSHLLGAWNDIFPFSLYDLGVVWKAKPTNSSPCNQGEIPIPPWSLGSAPTSTNSKQTRNQAILAHNEVAKNIQSTRPFVSSSGSSNSGLVCLNDVSLRGIFRNYFSAALAWDAREYRYYSGPSPWVLQELGVVAHHRGMCKVGDRIGHELNTDRSGLSYLCGKDLPLLQENLRNSVTAIDLRTNTLSGWLQQLENLGHNPCPAVSGLNIELLAFQRQAVGWAIERENTEGGVQSHLWVKIPAPSDGRQRKSKDVYFSPALDMFSHHAPEKVRGGILAEEMGLGKTVISLALVLLNPAPPAPESGTKVASFDLGKPDTSMQNGWTKGGKTGRPTSENSASRGSIFSRGTLVVCNVSLVGQWTDEAKSKLKDPGLICSYHGTNREKNATILAKNAIVVTTYATLASDAFYHKNKSNSTRYCPPCEKIRWWRIICDESHTLKDGNTRNSIALGGLVGENKWCVTGTPMNTSIADLRNQLAFVGIQHTKAMFGVFNSSSDGSDDWKGSFLFTMRNLMMRHSMKQKQRANGKDLMSLPSISHHTIRIPFSLEERSEYKKLEDKALGVYKGLKKRGMKEVRKRYLLVTSALTPLRIACAGGQILENDSKGANANKTGKKHVIDPENTTCSICQDCFVNPRATQCKPSPHVFCEECIEGVIGIKGSAGPCPLCRQPVKMSNLLCAEFPEVCHSEEKKSSKDETKNMCQFAFKSKVSRLLQELKKVRDEDPKAKSLIFSQFKSTLEWIKRELPMHGFQYRTLSGDMAMSKRAKALRDFQNDSASTVFLLSIRAGAVGINLTQANRVFLMEPAMNPALEAQAIGRVHRLGQSQKVVVTRLFMTESIETRLAELIEKKYHNKAGCKESDTNVSSGGLSLEDEQISSATNKNNSQKLMGSIRRDKAALIEEELDMLFGCRN